MYIVLYSATMLMIGPSTFLEEDEDELDKTNVYPCINLSINVGCEGV